MILQIFALLWKVIKNIANLSRRLFLLWLVIDFLQFLSSESRTDPKSGFCVPDPSLYPGFSYPTRHPCSSLANCVYRRQTNHLQIQGDFLFGGLWHELCFQKSSSSVLLPPQSWESSHVPLLTKRPFKRGSLFTPSWQMTGRKSILLRSLSSTQWAKINFKKWHILIMIFTYIL